jgi:lysophospholipase L1-like esterase
LATVRPEATGAPTPTFGARLDVAVFGDSIASAAWQKLLLDALRERDPSGSYSVSNFAKRATRLDYTERQVATFDPTEYQLAIVIVGRNDYKYVWPDVAKVAAYEKRMRALIASLESKGLIVLMANAPPDFVDGAITDGTAKLAQLIRDVAGPRLVDLEKLFRAQPDPARLYTDFEHQSAAGAAIIAAEFLQQLVDRGLIP